MTRAEWNAYDLVLKVNNSGSDTLSNHPIKDLCILQGKENLLLAIKPTPDPQD